MKDLLLIGLVFFVVVALFGDGGLEISPELSPELQNALDVNYAPDNSSVTNNIEHQVTGDYVENQTVVVEAQSVAPSIPVLQVGGGGATTLVEGRVGGQCFTVPGDVILTRGGNGECRVANGGQKYFISPSGGRQWLGAYVSEGNSEPTVLVRGRGK